MNDVAMNTGAKLSLQDCIFNCFGNIPRRGIAGSYINSIYFFIFLRSLPTVSHRDCTILHSHQQCTGFQFLHFLAWGPFLKRCLCFFFAHFSMMGSSQPGLGPSADPSAFSLLLPRRSPEPAIPSPDRSCTAGPVLFSL